jgi:hypothetical protein
VFSLDVNLPNLGSGVDSFVKNIFEESFRNCFPFISLEGSIVTIFLPQGDTTINQKNGVVTGEVGTCVQRILDFINSPLVLYKSISFSLS